MTVFRNALAFLLLACPALTRADGDFDAAQRAAQAQNPPGLTPTLSLDGGRTQFQQGEVIRLTLTFTGDRAGAYQMARWTLANRGFETFHVSPSAGTADPSAAVPPQTFFIYNGPPPPDPVAVTDKPVTVPLMVNVSVRFDRPGVYRLYVTTRRILDGHAKQGIFFVTGKTYTVTSSAVQFRVIPPDPVWAHTQAQAAQAEVQPHPTGPMTVQHPWDVLTSLGTPESARALLSLMAADQAPRSSEEKGYYCCRPGLIGYPDQGWLVGEMERDLTTPDYPVTQNFLNTLADLATWRKTPKVFDDGTRLRAYWLRAAQAVSTKSDTARPMTLHTLLEEAWLNPRIGDDAAARARLPGLTHQMALDFDRLPPLAQEYLLDGDWVNFRTPAVLPTLRRFWKIAKLVENSDDFQPDNGALNALVLRRLYEFSPAEGRRLVLQEMTSSDPRVPAESLEILPDKTLPGLDKTLAATLQSDRNSDGADGTTRLISRYATPTIFPQVRAVYGSPAHGWDCAPQAAFLAYFLRVKPAYGTVAVKQALAYRKNTGCYKSLLMEVADLHYDARLEEIAITSLSDADADVAANAAQTLGKYGSRRAEAALWARLQRTSGDGAGRQQREVALTDALTAAQNWYAGPARLKQIRAACVSIPVQQQLDEALRELGPGPVHMDYQINSDPGDWTVGQYHGQGLTAFCAKIAQFPRGTAFSWQDIGVGPEEDKLFAQTQRFAQRHGETLTRWHPKPLPLQKT